jgi:membrane protein implicated in regulation of membrane protease activity
MVLAGAEIIVGQLVLLMLAAGAVAGSAAAWSGAPLIWQVIIAGLVAALMLLVIRPVAIRHMNRADPNLRTGIDLVKGSRGVVLELVNANDGRVKVNGEIWSARSYDPYVTIDVGGNVSVVEVDGATVVVLPTEL